MVVYIYIYIYFNLTRNEFKTNHVKKGSITNIAQVQIPCSQEQPGDINLMLANNFLNRVLHF